MGPAAKYPVVQAMVLRVEVEQLKHPGRLGLEDVQVFWWSTLYVQGLLINSWSLGVINHSILY